MPDNPNRLTRFWQELKRRNVHRSLAVYAGTAFIILEAADIIFPRWGLPVWSIDIVLYLLIVGAVINLVIAWIYDITPKGVRKTKPSSSVPKGEEAVTPNSWKIATYVSLGVIIALIILNVFNRNKIYENTNLYGKSIAVLPFINDSPDEDNDYFINGTMESILNNLSKIKDLRVISRTSVEQYRGALKPIPEIAKEMNVSYILEGSMRKYGNRIRMTLQLIDQHDRHLWSEQYDRTIFQVEDLLSLESEIARLVAGEIDVIITPEEKHLIDKVPTTSLTANDFYSKGKEEFNKYFYQNNKAALDRAKTFYSTALFYDSTYAQAYAGLGWIYYEEHELSKEILSDTYLDSVLFYINKALLYDNQLAETYRLRGAYTMAVYGERQRALSDYTKALELNPNDQETYASRGNLYTAYLGDFVKGLEDLEQSLKRSSGSELASRLSKLGGVYTGIGFFDISNWYSLQILSLDGDSGQYFDRLLWNAYVKEDIETVLKLEKKIQEFRPQYRIGGYIAMDIGYNEVVIEEAKMIIDNHEAGVNESVVALYAYGLGYASWLSGEYAQAEYYFNLQIKYGEEIIKQNRAHAEFGHSHIDMTKVYAFTGNEEKAFEMLDDLAENLVTIPRWMIAMIKLCPMIEPIHGEPEYQKIMQKMELKYQTEHNRVRRWLEETGRMEQFILEP